jgi:hypothetical protein
VVHSRPMKIPATYFSQLSPLTGAPASSVQEGPSLWLQPTLEPFCAAIFIGHIHGCYIQKGPFMTLKYNHTHLKTTAAVGNPQFAQVAR